MDATRLTQESPRPRKDFRPEFRLDRDRVLYAPQFARLAEITQVVSPENGYVFHNRLTHSIKVAQIARSIAESMRAAHPAFTGHIDPDAAEAAGLAHDLGHPPFGHIAEQALDALVRGYGVPDGFEGNAQSFRIACRLGISDALDQNGAPIPGLNFTRATLNGILKYPWAHGGNPAKPDKWGYYETERDAFEFARVGFTGFHRSLTAEIMDWADDLTYAVHDVLDFYRARKIPLEQMRRLKLAAKQKSTKHRWKATDERNRFMTSVFARKPEWEPRQHLYESALDQVMDYFPFDRDHRYRGLESDEYALYLFSTRLITEFVVAMTPKKRVAGLGVSVPPGFRHKVDILKQLVWTYAIRDADLAMTQLGQVRAIRTVFRLMMRACARKNYDLFPEGYRSWFASAATKQVAVRAVADYIAGLTERDLLGVYRRTLATAR